MIPGLIEMLTAGALPLLAFILLPAFSNWSSRPDTDDIRTGYRCGEIRETTKYLRLRLRGDSRKDLGKTSERSEPENDDWELWKSLDWTNEHTKIVTPWAPGGAKNNTYKRGYLTNISDGAGGTSPPTPRTADETASPASGSIDKELQGGTVTFYIKIFTWKTSTKYKPMPFIFFHLVIYVSS